MIDLKNIYSLSEYKQIEIVGEILSEISSGEFTYENADKKAEAYKLGGLITEFSNKYLAEK